MNARYTQRLVQTLPKHLVLAQVQLLQVVTFKRGRRTYAILNRISQLSLDFLILNPDTSIVAAVELDDATHAREDRRQADARKDHALKSAGVPLIRWNAKNLPEAGEHSRRLVDQQHLHTRRRLQTRAPIRLESRPQDRRARAARHRRDECPRSRGRHRQGPGVVGARQHCDHSHLRSTQDEA